MSMKRKHLLNEGNLQPNKKQASSNLSYSPVVLLKRTDHLLHNPKSNRDSIEVNRPVLPKMGYSDVSNPESTVNERHTNNLKLPSGGLNTLDVLDKTDFLDNINRDDMKPDVTSSNDVVSSTLYEVSIIGKDQLATFNSDPVQTSTGDTEPQEDIKPDITSSDESIYLTLDEVFTSKDQFAMFNADTVKTSTFDVESQEDIKPDITSLEKVISSTQNGESTHKEYATVTPLPEQASRLDAESQLDIKPDTSLLCTNAGSNEPKVNLDLDKHICISKEENVNKHITMSILRSLVHPNIPPYTSYDTQIGTSHSGTVTSNTGRVSDDHTKTTTVYPIALQYVCNNKVTTLKTWNTPLCELPATLVTALPSTSGGQVIPRVSVYSPSPLETLKPIACTTKQVDTFENETIKTEPMENVTEPTGSSASTESFEKRLSLSDIPMVKSEDEKPVSVTEQKCILQADDGLLRDNQQLEEENVSSQKSAASESVPCKKQVVSPHSEETNIQPVVPSSLVQPINKFTPNEKQVVSPFSKEANKQPVVPVSLVLNINMLVRGKQMDNSSVKPSVNLHTGQIINMVYRSLLKQNTPLNGSNGLEVVTSTSCSSNSLVTSMTNSTQPTMVWPMTNICKLTSSDTQTIAPVQEIKKEPNCPSANSNFVDTSMMNTTQLTMTSMNLNAVMISTANQQHTSFVETVKTEPMDSEVCHPSRSSSVATSMTISTQQTVLTNTSVFGLTVCGNESITSPIKALKTEPMTIDICPSSTHYHLTSCMTSTTQPKVAWSKTNGSCYTASMRPVSTSHHVITTPDCRESFGGMHVPRGMESNDQVRIEEIQKEWVKQSQVDKKGSFSYLKTPCQECGLMLRTAEILSHKKLHECNKGTSLFSKDNLVQCPTCWMVMETIPGKSIPDHYCSFETVIRIHRSAGVNLKFFPELQGHKPISFQSSESTAGSQPVSTVNPSSVSRTITKPKNRTRIRIIHGNLEEKQSLNITENQQETSLQEKMRTEGIKRQQSVSVTDKLKTVLLERQKLKTVLLERQKLKTALLERQQILEKPKAAFTEDQIPTTVLEMERLYLIKSQPPTPVKRKQPWAADLLKELKTVQVEEQRTFKQENQIADPIEKCQQMSVSEKQITAAVEKKQQTHEQDKQRTDPIEIQHQAPVKQQENPNVASLIPCELCGLLRQNTPLFNQAHYELHKTIEGKKLFSSEHLIQCSDCGMVMMKTNPQHLCDLEMIKSIYKRNGMNLKWHPQLVASPNSSASQSSVQPCVMPQEVTGIMNTITSSAAIGNSVTTSSVGLSAAYCVKEFQLFEPKGDRSISIGAPVMTNDIVNCQLSETTMDRPSSEPLEYHEEQINDDDGSKLAVEDYAITEEKQGESHKKYCTKSTCLSGSNTADAYVSFPSNTSTLVKTNSSDILIAGRVKPSLKTNGTRLIQNQTVPTQTNRIYNGGMGRNNSTVGGILHNLDLTKQQMDALDHTMHMAHIFIDENGEEKIKMFSLPIEDSNLVFAKQFIANRQMEKQLEAKKQIEEKWKAESQAQARQKFKAKTGESEVKVPAEKKLRKSNIRDRSDFIESKIPCSLCGMLIMDSEFEKRQHKSLHKSPEADVMFSSLYLYQCTDCGMVLQRGEDAVSRHVWKVDHMCSLEVVEAVFKKAGMEIKWYPELVNNGKIPDKIHRHQMVVCEICGLSLTALQLKAHCIQHEMKKFICNVCARNLDTEAKLEAHKNEKHKEGVCQHCGKVFESEKDV